MERFTREWDRIKGKIKNKPVYLFLDFDGTLAPIRKHPGKVRLSKAARDVIKKLASQENIFIAIISGRKLREVKKLVGVRSIVYVGNHGFEAEGPGLKFAAPKVLGTKKILAKISKKLKKGLSSIHGAFVEDKGLTLSVHFRMVKRNRLKEAERIFKTIAMPYKIRGKVFITGGKKVWEVRPPIKWNKGSIVSALLGKKKKTGKKIIPFYIGDDRTDEDAFRLVRRKGYAVKVGRKDEEYTSADYYMQNTKAVREFLRGLLALRREEKYV